MNRETLNVHRKNEGKVCYEASGGKKRRKKSRSVQCVRLLKRRKRKYTTSEGSMLISIVGSCRHRESFIYLLGLTGRLGLIAERAEPLCID